MATPKKTTALAPAYDADTQYRVQLALRIDVLSQTFYPGADLTLRGDVLNTLEPAAIAGAEPVPARAEA